MLNEEYISNKGTENQIRGTAYELQILDLIRQNKPAYLWKFTPENILIENGIIGSHNAARLKRKTDRDNPLQDTGIDIIAMENHNECSLIQCKNGYKKGVSMCDLAGFMCWMACMPDKRGIVYYTDKLSANIMSLPKIDKIKYIQQPFDTKYLTILNSQCEDKTQVITNTQHIFTPDITKLEYQNKARDLAVEYYRHNDNGILSMPCGTGKTYTSFLIALNFKQIIMLSPLKLFAKQNLERFVEYGFPIRNTLLVDSDGCRDITKISEFIANNSNTGYLISATYDSADVISSILNFIQLPSQTLFICDEFHNLTHANVSKSNDSMYKIIAANGYKKLFMSATPRIFDLEEEGETGDYLLGRTIYDMSFKYAIDSGFITDYRVWLPSIQEDISDLKNDIHKELGIKDVLGKDNIVYSKSIYLFSCLINTGSQKCIIYCTNTEEIDILMSTINKLNEYYCIDLHMGKITSETNASSRTHILNKFTSSSQIELLFSIRILDECIDIPSCDSIYITYQAKSKIRTIQRLMRCTRTIKTNKYKIGNVFLWCSEYDSILDILGGIKEIDSSFAEKVMINEVGQFRERGTKTLQTLEADKLAIKKLVIDAQEFKFLSWNTKLEMLKQYIDESGTKPSIKDEKHKFLNIWLNNQIKNFKYKLQIMKFENIEQQWYEFINSDKYKMHFMSHTDVWMNLVTELKEYINIHKKLPSTLDKDKKIQSLGTWVSKQQSNYKNKTALMKNDNIYIYWNELINNLTYKEYFINNTDIWMLNYDKLINYINTNKKLPCRNKNNSMETKSLNNWLNMQNQNFKIRKYIMKNEDIYTIWNNFTNNSEYKIYFIDNEEAWQNSFITVKEYINKYNKLPVTTSKDKDVRILGTWISTQKKSYKHKTQIMKNERFYTQWTQFINSVEYKDYFLNNIEMWMKNYEMLKSYVSINNKFPSAVDKNIKVRALGCWLSSQKENYKKQTQIMKLVSIYNIWTSFKNDTKYKIYF